MRKALDKYSKEPNAVWLYHYLDSQYINFKFLKKLFYLIQVSDQMVTLCFNLLEH